MNFIMTPSTVFRQKLRESVRKNYCPVSIQIYLTFIYMILLNRTGMIDVSNVSLGTHINEAIVLLTSFVV